MSVFVFMLPIFGCGLMMWFCARGMCRSGRGASEVVSSVQIEELRAEVARLRSSLNADRPADAAVSLDH